MGRVAIPLSVKEAVSPYQTWRGESLSPIWCHLCSHRPRLSSSLLPAQMEWWVHGAAMDVAASLSLRALLGHIKPAALPVPKLAPHTDTPRSRRGGCSTLRSQGQQVPSHSAANGETEAGKSALGMLLQWHHASGQCRPLRSTPKPPPIAAGRALPESWWESGQQRWAAAVGSLPRTAAQHHRPRSPQGS